MNDAQYRQLITDARNDLAQRLERRAKLDKEITQLKATIAALASFCGDKNAMDFLHSIAEEAGLTEGCREVLRTADKALTTVEVKEQLARLGYDLNKYSNALASIHAVLRRLVEANEAQTVPPRAASGRPTSYKWGKRPSTFETLASLTDKGAPPFGTGGKKQG